jgi:hypothetical protein
VLVEKQIFQLEIAVDNVLLVEIVHPRDELSKEALRVAIFEVLVGENMVKELPT